jgi:hypothetical protein
LVLNSNTKLFGVSQNYSRLISNSSWSAGHGKFMVETVNDQNATTYLGSVTLYYNATHESDITAGCVHWMAGRNSMIFLTKVRKAWGSYYGLQVRHSFRFTGSAGGRHFISPHDVDGATNSDSRHLYIEGTNQPLCFYGLNVESTKHTKAHPNLPVMGSNIEIVNSKNIRIYSTKREGRSPTIIIRDSQNIGYYGMGRFNGGIWSGIGGYIQILGNSANIVFAPVVLDNIHGSGGYPMLMEAITGLIPEQIDWPGNVSIYKRGELSDINVAEISDF